MQHAARPARRPNKSADREGRPALAKSVKEEAASERLLLPGAFLVAIGAELLAAFMLVDLRFASFLQ